MKYRIVKRASHYEVEKRFLWAWITIDAFGCDIQGFGHNYPIRFETYDAALKWVRRNG